VQVFHPMLLSGVPVQFPFKYVAVVEVGQINFLNLPGTSYGSTKQVSQQIGVIISGFVHVIES
jgi:hypothetical protein